MPALQLLVQVSNFASPLLTPNPIASMNAPEGESFSTLASPASGTHRSPLASTATAVGGSNWPPPDPFVPNAAPYVGGTFASLPTAAGSFVSIGSPVEGSYSVVCTRSRPLGSVVTEIGLRSFQPSNAWLPAPV